ncbi:MAG TPA: serine/threonine-protein kinase [Polyangiaceae bacterium]|jgi:serine/threonine-protein kinase|nr:serine/threonine-protein kinase [Polyangiaceae bacterium]
MLPSKKPDTPDEASSIAARRESISGRSPPADPAPSRSGPRDAGKYKLLAELGRGGMANVYLAVARGPNGFNKLVVLKCLRSDLASDQDLLAMFLDEARLAARLNHPHVVQTYEVGEYAGRPVIVMEYLEGQTLSNLLQRTKGANRLPLALHLRVIVDALEGLHHAHELADFAGKPLGLVHRDVSPQNVFVTFDGQVKVLDFGIAKAVNSQAQTTTGVLKGKVQYMAPEQMLGAKVDRRADLYAVGVMAWEAATGQRMWKGQTDLHVMNKVANDGVPSPRDVEPTLSPALEAIVLKALARDPDDRYATALEFGAELEAIIDHLGTGASNRNLGKMVRDLFEDARAQTRAIVEAQLLEAADDDTDQHLIPPNLVRISTRPEESPGLGTSSTLARNALIEVRPKRRGLLAVGAAVAIAAVVGLLIARSPRQAGPQAVPAIPPTIAPVASAAPAALPPPTPSQPAAPPEVSVAISSNPKRATLFLDGRQVPSNPYTGTVPVDGAIHRVRAEAPGYASRTVEVAPDHDIEVAMVLDALPSRGRQGTQITSPPVPTVAPPAGDNSAGTSNPSANNHKCNPPYYVDADGIKRFKPDCL